MINQPGNKLKLVRNYGLNTVPQWPIMDYVDSAKWNYKGIIGIVDAWG